MKKKLEAELISIAHRILKLKNRAELDQLQQETLKLYEKISVLRFVEDNFSDVKPTIGYASAEETLEEIYGLEEERAESSQSQSQLAEETRNTQPATEEESSQSQSQSEDKPQVEEPQATGQEEGESQVEEQEEETRNAQPETEKSSQSQSQSEDKPQVEEPQATGQEEGEPQVEEQAEETHSSQHETEETEEPEDSADPEQPVEEYQASEEEIKITEEKEEESSQSQSADETTKAQSATEATPNAFNQESSTGFSFDFEPKKTDEPTQKEITFEDFHNYKEPEFVKKEQEPQTANNKLQDEVSEPENVQEEWLPKEPEVIAQQEENIRDWRDWEPTKDEPGPQATSHQPQAETRNSQPATVSTRSLSLGLNDRIAFEKNLFGGSGEDLNRVISQLNTFNTFDEAKEFIADMVKPDYNNWQGKEEYEERFMALVEKKFD